MSLQLKRARILVLQSLNVFALHSKPQNSGFEGVPTIVEGGGGGRTGIIIYIYIYIWIYGHPPPHDRPCPSKHRSHRRVRAFSGVSSLSPPNVSVKNHPTTETKKPKLHGECWNSFGFLVFFWFFGSFGSLVLWFFGSLDVWFYCGEGYISKKLKKQKNQRTKKPKSQKTKEPKNQRTKKNKKTKLFQHSPWSFGFLVFWFRSSGGSSRTRSEGSSSIPRKKQINTCTNTKLTLIPR